MIRRLVPIALILVLFGCSRSTDVSILATDDLPPELYEESREPATGERPIRATLYFVATDASGRNLDAPARLAKLEHEVRSTRPRLEEVSSLILQGPRDVVPGQRTMFIGTAIFPGTQLLSVSVEEGLADVNLSAQFESAESELLQMLRVAQVVYTLTELSEVDSVRFAIHGATQPVVDQEGTAHERVTRAQYSRFAPADSVAGEVESQVSAGGD